MNQLELLDLARACSANITSDLAQVITINFAMVVAIFYFLNEAKLGIKIFAYFAYLVGMLLYIGVMIAESNVALATLNALKALPPKSLAAPIATYVALTDSWLAHATTFVTMAALLILLFGIFYLLFFWKKAAHIRGFDKATD